jgi:glycosyltransferase involved in cell wall biosynthesis
MKSSSVSIIVPCKKFDEYVDECVKECKKLDYKNFEIILLPDVKIKKINKVRIIPTGNVSPGKKRNIGVKHSKGEFYAFIDSDAYPKKNWLKNAIKYFSKPEVVALGGPGVTPENDSNMQKAGGLVMSSFLMAGMSTRYKTGKINDSDDIHSCNFIARKSLFKKIKWNEKYWPGEDTLLCLDIKKLGGKMLEAQDVVVYHHRRPLFRKHLAQVSKFGLHRGFFAKKFPETSFRLTYFIPSFFVLFLLLGWVINRYVYISVIAFYLTLTLLSAFLLGNLKLLFLVWFGIIKTHISYGVFFLIGFLRKELKR